MTLSSLLPIVVMVLGFGFVIFWHELGHFLGARWAGIRVVQFAVGMGHALVSYRKGLGFRFGSSQAEFDRLTQREFDAREIQEKERRDAEGRLYEIRGGEPSLPERYDIARDLGLGETEYRLSMLPIGGYVKPTGQDDLRPSRIAALDDPRCYAAAPVEKRMVMIAAGVVMNVILAGLLFCALFIYGFKVQRAVVGQLQSASPAAQVGLRAGDELLELNGHALPDFTKVLMNVALLPSDESVPLVIRRNGEVKTLSVRPRSTSDNSKMLAIGFSPAMELANVPSDDHNAAEINKAIDEEKPGPLMLRPGERVASVDGKPINIDDVAAFGDIIQNAYGREIPITIADEKGQTRTANFVPNFALMFDRQPLNLFGLQPRTMIASVPAAKEESAAAGILFEGDVVLAVAEPDEATQQPTTAPTTRPSADTFIKITTGAGHDGRPLVFTVLRDGKAIELPPIVPVKKIEGRTYGLGVGVTQEQTSVIGTVMPGSTADRAGLVGGTTVTAINGTPVSTWSQVHRAMVELPGATSIRVTTKADDGTTKDQDVALADADLALARTLRYANPIDGMREWTITRQTSNPLTAMAWGVGETRDLILQGYLTIRRVFGGSVPASNMSGPLGIFRAGTGFAQRGPDWFIWFLAVISANLAVVNFLPIPILDGWHFLSLLKEKVTGKPVSDRVQEVAQYVGLTMILSLIVFVTYNDIMRW